ncbi:MAG: hypothetical protein HKM95_02475 [Inquilinus sp.]|nr:hypothetical protein [Inquilinus sp.]
MTAPRHADGGRLGIAALALAAIALSACSSTQQVSHQRMMAPVNMEVAERREVAVVEFTGEGGQQISDRLAATLENVRLNGQPVFRVDGPVRLHRGRHASIGNVDRADALDYARSVGAGAVVMGQADFDTDTQLREPDVSESCVTRDQLGNCVKTAIEIRQCVDITVSLTYAAEALDTATGSPIYNRRPGDLKDRTTECLSTGDNPALLITRLMNNDFERSVAGLRNQLIARAAADIHRDIAPYAETFQVAFLREPDTATGAAAAEFEQANDLVGAGQAEAACAVWQRMARSGVSDLALSYNLAACAENSGNYRAAMEAYDAVDTMIFRMPRSGGGDPNYDLEDWAGLLSAARGRVARLHESEETLAVFAGAPSF